MLVWLINPYGNIPGEGWSEYRSTMVARSLEKAGHDVVWWVSNFVHRAKTVRHVKSDTIQISPSFTVRVVPSTPYQSHISLSRIRYEQCYARNLYHEALSSPRPDVVIIADPSLFFCKPILKLVEKWQTKLIVDVIDLWPELFHIILPDWFSPLGKFLFLPLYRRRAALYRRADAIVAVTRDYLSLARTISPKRYMEVVYWGADVPRMRNLLTTPVPLPLELTSRSKSDGEVWAIYAGTLGDNYDIRSILKAAEIFVKKNVNIKLIIAGDGPLKQLVTGTISEKNLMNTVYVGSLAPSALTYLYSFCDLALSTYIPRSTVSMPIKAFDYFVAGLPVLNSLKGDLGQMVEENSVGLQYEAGNAESLAEMMTVLCSNADLRCKMSRNARLLGESFDVAKQYYKFVNVVENVMINL
jgi:glycosyltransferase involved in cell wall biosynthesis